MLLLYHFFCSFDDNKNVNVMRETKTIITKATLLNTILIARHNTNNEKPPNISNNGKNLSKHHHCFIDFL